VELGPIREAGFDKGELVDGTLDSEVTDDD